MARWQVEFTSTSFPPGLIANSAPNQAPPTNDDAPQEVAERPEPRRQAGQKVRLAGQGKWAARIVITKDNALREASKTTVRDNTPVRPPAEGQSLLLKLGKCITANHVALAANGV
jgi:hypothetical protein